MSTEIPPLVLRAVPPVMPVANAAAKAEKPAGEPGPDVVAERRVEPARKVEVEVTKEHLAELEEAVNKINDYVQTRRADLLFNVDEELNRLIVQVVDSESQEVIRQIPSDETLAMARQLQDPEATGLIFKNKA